MLLLLELVREFESRRGEILNLFAKKKVSTIVAQSVLPSLGKHQFDASRPGKKELKRSRDKNARHKP